jgi:hypothetical protein
VRIVVISSCSAEKAAHHRDQLLLEDFEAGPKRVSQREAPLDELMLPAEELYLGQQHKRMMRGIAAARSSSELKISLHILSAGYGLVPAHRRLAPYDATFQGMKQTKLRAWADALGVPQALRTALAEPYDLALVLLGDTYLTACAFQAGMTLGGPTVVFCGKNRAKRMGPIDGVLAVPLGNAHAKRFRAGLVAIKGELTRRLLGRLVTTPDWRPPLDDAEAFLDTLEQA